MGQLYCKRPRKLSIQYEVKGRLRSSVDDDKFTKKSISAARIVEHAGFMAHVKVRETFMRGSTENEDVASMAVTNPDKGATEAVENSYY